MTIRRYHVPFEADEPIKLSAVINVRLATEEKAELVRQAEEAGLSVSDLVRRRALGRRVEAAMDRVTVNELRRLGVLFKSALEKGADPVQTKGVLQAVREAIERVAR